MKTPYGIELSRCRLSCRPDEENVRVRNSEKASRRLARRADRGGLGTCGAGPRHDGAGQRAGQRARAHPADGLERLEPFPVRHQRVGREEGGRRDGQQGPQGGGLPVHQHRRLLGEVQSRLARQPGTRPGEVPRRHLRYRQLRAQQGAQARHLPRRRYAYLRHRGLPRLARPREAGRQDDRLVGRGLPQVRQLP